MSKYNIYVSYNTIHLYDTRIHIRTTFSWKLPHVFEQFLRAAVHRLIKTSRGPLGSIKSYDSLKRRNDSRNEMLSRCRAGSLTTENVVFALQRREQRF